MSKLSMDKLVALCKNRGFIFAGSEIYGGLANSWDYGHLGSELIRNIKNAWWKKFVHESSTNVGLDSSILLNPQVWVASGHVVNFNDPLIDCKSCKARFRADHLIEEYLEKHPGILPADTKVDGWSFEQYTNFIQEHQVKCPMCGKSDFTEIRKFNMMLRTFQGAVESSATQLYLRPETAQGIFVNFKSVQRTSRRKIPFGIAQVGKAFRNEITPGNFIFRTIEFEQMELEFFCEPGTDLEWFSYWRSYCMNWLKDLGIPEAKLRFRDHEKEELSHYSNATTDIEFEFPFGWGELWGIADRTDYDLKAHMAESKEDLMYQDPYDNSKRYIPYVIEPSLGVNRVALAFLSAAYEEEALEDGTTRTVLHLHPALAPVKVAVLPLVKKLSEKADEVFAALSKQFNVEYDEAGAIGKRYRRQDEIGTPFCITVDFDTLEDGTVTIRHRDSMAQERVTVDQAIRMIQDSMIF
ncbi:MAG: glycine--tRNA ligase [Bacillota bacterium]|nr:glycine--tRNA ligase [Bacillota bacterium]